VAPGAARWSPAAQAQARDAPGRAVVGQPHGAGGRLGAPGPWADAIYRGEQPSRARANMVRFAPGVSTRIRP
jgi:hypothetical protein